jgi:hypothetical protein
MNMALYAATYSDRTMRAWWDGMSNSTIRARLHGWCVWANYRKQEKDPASLITEFVAYINEVNTPYSYRIDGEGVVRNSWFNRWPGQA